MRDWVLIGVGVVCLAGLAMLAHGCGKGGPRAEVRTTLTEADRSALEAAAGAIAAAAQAGTAGPLDAAINPNLPPREARAVRTALAALKGRGPFTVTKAEGLKAGGAVVTVEGGGAARTWRFDRIGDAWKLSSL